VGADLGDLNDRECVGTRRNDTAEQASRRYRADEIDRPTLLGKQEALRRLTHQCGTGPTKKRNPPSPMKEPSDARQNQSDVPRPLGNGDR